MEHNWPSTSRVYVKRALEKAEICHESNESLLVLIPKEENPSSIKAFRLINLFNVNVKLALKVMNILKGIRGNMISPN